MSRGRIAIIGGGFSGATLAANVLRRGRCAPDVVLAGRDKRFGPGLAYGGDDKRHLLNVRAANMSAYADQPDHFTRWLAARGQRDAGAAFIARATYGVYIEDVLNRASSGWGGPKLKRVRGEVVACRPGEGGGWRLTLAGGKSFDADAVVLALGHAAPSAPAIFRDAGVTLLDPWDRGALSRIGAGDVLLLGAGLTMIDVALSLAAKRKRGVIYALSRRGQIPRAHLDDAAPAPAGSLDLPLSLSEGLHVLHAEARAMAARGEPWQYAVDRLRARTPELWRRLAPDAQHRFLRHLRVWWDVHRHRAPPEIALRVKALMEEGRLRVLAGEVVSAAPGPRGVRLQHRGRGSLARHNMDVAAIVNCTGASPDVGQRDDPLTHQLLRDGVARPHVNGLGFDIDADSRIVDANGAPQQGLFAIGPITMGAFWESTAVPEIRVRAAAIAAMLSPESET